MKKLTKLAAAVGIAALALTGCSAAGDSSPAPGEGAAEAVAGGEMTLAWLAGGSNLDNAILNSVSIIDGAPLTAIYGQLVYQNTDGDVIAHLAESLETTDGGTTWVLTLREGLKFSDGTDLDADAVVANFDRLVDPAVASPKGAYLAGVSYAAADLLTVEIVLPAASPKWDRDFAAGLAFMASPTAFAADPEGFRNSPVGAGPFMVDNWIQGDSLILIPNPEYPSDIAPLLDSLTIKVISDHQQALTSVTSGSIDGAFTNLPDINADAAAAGMQLTEFFPGGGGMTLANVSSGDFVDPRAREAIQLGVDRQALLDSAYGAGEAATSLWPEDSPWYSADADFADHDPEAAQELLDELAAEGKALDFNIMTNEPLRMLAEAMQAQLLTYDNITVGVDVLDNPTHTSRLRAGDFELAQAGWAWPQPYPSLMEMFAEDGVRNYGGYMNADVLGAFDEATVATSADEEAAAFAKAQAQIVSDSVVFVSYHWPMTIYTNTNVGGVTLTGNGSTMLWEQLGFVE